MQGWYFSPDIKNYHVIKTVTEKGAVIITDTFKFKHNTIKTPTVTPSERIVKATQALALTMQAKNDTPLDELEAITNLQDLILGNNKNVHTKYKTVELVNAPTPINNAQPSK